MKLFLLISIPFFALLLAGCEDEKVQPATVKEARHREIPAQESWNSTVQFSDSGRVKALLTAGHLQMMAAHAETELDSSIKVEFFNRTGKISTTLTARRGKVDDRSKYLYAYENVVVKNDSGVTLNTEELVWNNDKERITTDKFVTIISKYEKIQGYGFESDQFLRNYVIYRITYTTTNTGTNE